MASLVCLVSVLHESFLMLYILFASPFPFISLIIINILFFFKIILASMPNKFPSFTFFPIKSLSFFDPLFFMPPSFLPFFLFVDVLSPSFSF